MYVCLLRVGGCSFQYLPSIFLIQIQPKPDEGPYHPPIDKEIIIHAVHTEFESVLPLRQRGVLTTTLMDLDLFIPYVLRIRPDASFH